MPNRLGDLLAEKVLSLQPAEEENREKDDLKEQIAAICQRIAETEDLFNNAQNDALLEASIYQMKALSGYLDFLLKKARGKETEQGMFVPAEEQLERIGGVMG